jgi:hypothetical protein
MNLLLKGFFLLSSLCILYLPAAAAAQFGLGVGFGVQRAITRSSGYEWIIPANFQLLYRVDPNWIAAVDIGTGKYSSTPFGDRTATTLPALLGFEFENTGNGSHLFYGPQAGVQFIRQFNGEWLVEPALRLELGTTFTPKGERYRGVLWGGLNLMKDPASNGIYASIGLNFGWQLFFVKTE